MTTELQRRLPTARARTWTRLWLVGGWIGVALTFLFSLTPPTLGHDASQTDKLVHLAGYAVLTYWWAQLVVSRRIRLALAVFALGVLIEGLQGLTPNREPDVYDALANATGVLLGWTLAHHTPNLLARLTSRPPGLTL